MEREMEFFIEGTNYDIRKVVKEEPFVPTHNIDGVIVDKSKKKRIGLKRTKRICNTL